MIVRPRFSRLPRLAFQSPCYQCWIQHKFTRPELTQLIILLQRPFSTRPNLRDGANQPNHYEVLGVAPNVTKAELKKQFYKLSKETHPDLHKNDPKAPERFSQISESYSILASEEKRRRYDRDHMRQNQSAAQRSGTYAGSRPASGLSRRRGTFRGAPPSFHAQGGYGSTGRQSQSNQQAHHQGGTFNAAAFTERGRYDPDFNSDPILRTQSAEDAKRSRRMQAAIDMERAEIDRTESFWVRFIVVTTIVLAGVTAGTMLVSMRSAPRGGLTRSDGSKRDGPRNEWAKG